MIPACELESALELLPSLLLEAGVAEDVADRAETALEYFSEWSVVVIELTKSADVACDGMDAEFAVVDSLVNTVLDVSITSELAGAVEVA